MHQNVRKMTVWALLFLPLVAVGVAVALMLSWNGSHGAQAAGPSPDMALVGVGLNCDTNPNSAAPAKCNVPVGTQFTINGDLLKIAGLVDTDGDTISGYLGLQWHIVTTAGLTLKETPTVGGNTLPEIVWPGCSIRAETNTSPQDRLIGCQSGIGAVGDTFLGTTMVMDVNCVTQGAQTITSTNSSPADSYITDENNSGVPDTGSAAEVLTINCTPPDGVIQIDKVDDVTNAKVGPSCWEVFVLITPNPLSPNVTINVPVDVVGDNGKVCAGATGAFSDGNAGLGDIDITISGAAQVAAGSTEWHVLETQAPPKYVIVNQTKQICDFAAGPTCPLTIGNTRVDGNINVRFNDNVTGGVLAGQCVDISGVGTICDGDANDGDADAGEISTTQPLGAYTCDYNPVNQPADRQVKAPSSVDCSVSAQTPKASVKFSFNPTVPFNLKLPALQNLFLTAQGAKLPPSTCEDSTDTATFTHELSNAPSSADPKDPSAVQQVGGFEMEVRFDEKLVCVNLEAGAYFTGTAGAVCFIDDKDQGLRPEGLARIGCVVKGKPTSVSSSLELARIIVRPQPELYSQIIANQDNGVVAQILNQDCNLADMQGHPIQKIGCDDSELTIRFLEGDVNGDCSVDVADQQLLAFRWGAEVGNQLYNPRFDLEPSGQIKGDGDLDIKDVQFVFGRHGSTCAAPHPDQPPLNGKLANP